RPSRLKEIEDAGMSLCRRVLDDFKPMLDAIGAPELMTEEGCLAIYETEAEFAGDRGHIEMMLRYGFEHRVLSGKEIQDHEPTLSPKVAKAVLLPNNKSIRNPYHLVLKLVDAAKAAGATFVSGEAQGVERKPDGTVSLRLSDGRRLEADDI